MPNNETFQINRFQIKTCESWGANQQNYVPMNGEPIYVVDTATITGVPTPIFVIGDGANTLSWLVSNGRYYVYKQTIPQPGNSVYATTTNGTSSFGEAATWARSDHKHTLDRKITVGTSETPPSNGANGDIYIQVEG